MLEEFNNDNDLFHSDYQIENFILIQNGHTPYGTYKQALRELSAREQSLRCLFAKEIDMQISLDEIKLDIQENLNKEDRTARDDLTLKRLKLRQAELDYGLKDMEKVKKETEREFRKFYSCAKYLKERLGNLTDERKAILEEEYWKESLKDAIACDLKSTGQIDPKHLKRIEDCSFEVRCEIKSLLHVIKKDQDTLKKFLEAYPNRTPFPKGLSLELPCDIKQLVEKSSASDVGQI